MELGIIVAVSQNGVIGNKDKLPWARIPGDLPRFKELTLGKPVIMGRKTYESIGGPLLGRTNIVVTSKDIRNEIIVARSLNDAIKIAEEKNFSQAWVIGGRRLYEEALQRADVLEMTRIHRDYEGDTYFPEVDWNQWNETLRIPKDGYDFVTYRRKR